MTKIFFGTAGVPRSAPASDTISGIECVKSLGLNCMEIEFVRGVNMTPALAEKVRQTKQRLNIRLTVHAPYFINLASKEPAKVSASIQRILESARIGTLCGAESVTFHAGFYQGRPLLEVYQTVKAGLEKMLKQLPKDIVLAPELTGKPSQFGSLEELLNLAKEIKRVGFCLDISHLHARSGGKYNTYREFARVWETIQKELGKDALNNMHLHISGIKYTPKGEREHLNLRESDFNYQDFLMTLKDYQVGGFLICESPNLEGDALMLKKAYQSTALSMVGRSERTDKIS